MMITHITISIVNTTLNKINFIYSIQATLADIVKYYYCQYHNDDDDDVKQFSNLRIPQVVVAQSQQNHTCRTTTKNVRNRDTRWNGNKTEF